MRWRRAVAAVVAGSAVLVVPQPAWAVACPSAPQVFPVVKGVPAEDLGYAPRRLARWATGAGVRVAVIDSGVDAGHPQLRGHVARGRDFLRGDDSGRQDCVGHGTAVASIIAAQPVAESGFQGLAPGVTIVPVRISEQQDIDGKTVGDRGTPRLFAEAIDWAVGPGDAQVINVSLVMTDDNGLVRDAVRRAVAAGVVVVAAAGNRAAEGSPVPYPAAYDGVIGVGAVTFAGVRAPFSQRGGYVDLVATGQGVTVAARGAGHTTQEGTSFSTPYVSATAALILQRFPGSSPAEVARRLTATADPAPGGARSAEYGFGLLSPYRALTASLGPAVRAPAVPVTVRGEDPAVVAVARRQARSRQVALVFAAVGAGLVLVVGAVAVVVRRGRRRGWRPAV